jgi:hypothetical protein
MTQTMCLASFWRYIKANNRILNNQDPRRNSQNAGWDSNRMLRATINSMGHDGEFTVLYSMTTCRRRGDSRKRRTTWVCYDILASTSRTRRNGRLSPVASSTGRKDGMVPLQVWGEDNLREGVMAVKHPSALHQKGLKNYTTPDASTVVTEEGTLDIRTRKHNNSWFRLCVVQAFSPEQST